MQISFDKPKYGLEINRCLGLSLVDAAAPVALCCINCISCINYSPVEEGKLNHLRLTVDVAARQGCTAATTITTTSNGQIDNVNEISEIPVRENHGFGSQKT